MNTLEENIDQLADKNLQIIIELMKNGRIEEKEPETLKACSEDAFILWKKRKLLRLRGGLLYYLEGKDYKVIIPKGHRTDLIKIVHETFAHIGTNKTLRALKDDYYWPNMDFDVRLYINSCRCCNQRKVQRMGRNVISKGDLESNYPFHKISVDITGPLPLGPHGEQYILGIIDNFSRFVSLVPLKRATAETVAKALYEKWVTIFGVPEVIHSDRGTEFENQLMFNLCSLLGIRKSRSSPYYPKGNSIVERLFGTVKDMLSTTMKSRKRNWVEILPSIEMALRCTIHKSTNFSPYEVIFGRKMKTPFTNVAGKQGKNGTMPIFVQGLKVNLDFVQKKILEAKKEKIEINKTKPYMIGRKVMVKILPEVRGINYPRYEGPYTIVGRKGDWGYVLEDKNGNRVERNIHHLKPIRSKKTSTRVLTSVESASHERNCEPLRQSIQEPRYPTRQRSQPIRYGHC